jgi:hypothetical protein
MTTTARCSMKSKSGLMPIEAGNDINLQNINQDHDSNKRIEPHFPVINSPIFDDLTEILKNVSSVLTQRNHRGSLGLVRMPTQESPVRAAQEESLFVFPLHFPNLEGMASFQEKLEEKRG